MSDTAGKRFPFSLPSVSAPSLPSVSLKGVLGNQRVIWGLFVVLVVVTAVASLFRGFLFARLGMNLPTGVVITPIVWEVVANIHYVVFVVGYLIALPLDTVPGRGKYAEFVGDATFAGTLFFAGKAFSSLGFIAERIAIHWGTGVPAETLDMLAVEARSVAGYGLAAVVLTLVLRSVIHRFSASENFGSDSDDEDEQD